VLENKAKVLSQYQNYKAKTYIKSVENIDKKIVKKKEEVLPPSPDEQLKIEINTPVKKDSIPSLNLFE
jgi:hypothetical protein